MDNQQTQESKEQAMNTRTNIRTEAVSTNDSRKPGHSAYAVRKVICALLAAGALGGGSRAANVLVNGDFETGQLPPWSGVPYCMPWSVLKGAGHTGFAGATVTVPGGGNAAAIAQSFPDTLGADITECSIWVKCSQGKGGEGYFRMFASDQSWVGVSFPSDDIWHQLTVTGFDPAKTYDGCMVALTTDAFSSISSTGFVDDVVIGVVPEPASLGLLGLGVLVLRRWR